MNSPDTAAQIVARFLRANHYNDTLEAFIQEAGLSEDAGSLSPGAWTVEQILQEKVEFDASLRFEKQGETGDRGWSVPSPTIPLKPQVQTSSNVLHVNSDPELGKITITSADRTWRQCSDVEPFENGHASCVGDSPVLSTAFVPGGFVLSTSMSGALSLRRSGDLAMIDERRDHMKMAVQVISHRSGHIWLVATAGWDQKINIYAPNYAALQSNLQAASDGGIVSLPGCLGRPIHTITLQTNPESMIFTRHPDTDEIYLVASRRDSTYLYYFKFQEDATGRSTFDAAGKQNLAPHSNAWVAFTPCSLASCPNDPTLIAVATSHLPHLKLILVRLLFPDERLVDLRTPASMARADLARQDREDAAISIHVSTMAPQTPYSTPQVVWRPDGSGLFVNGDDGAIRGVEASTGKVISILKGHEAGSKVRTLWAGYIVQKDSNQLHEILVSGGFDKTAFIWTSTKEI